jgi:hypothetical protein
VTHIVRLFRASLLAFMLHGVPWFLLGSLWAIFLCEWRASRARKMLKQQIFSLQAEIAAKTEDQVESEHAYRDYVRSQLLDLLDVATRSTRRVPMKRLQANPAE